LLQSNIEPQLLQEARTALAKRFKTDTESAHGLIHIAMMAARLHDAQIPMVNLNRFAQGHYVYNNSLAYILILITEYQWNRAML